MITSLFPTCYRSPLVVGLLSILWPCDFARACTNIIVGRNASADGSVMLTYSVDGIGLGNLHVLAGREAPDPDVEDAVEADWKGPTYRVVGYLN